MAFVSEHFSWKELAPQLAALAANHGGRYHRIPANNAQAVLRRLEGVRDTTIAATYKKGEEVVHKGSIVPDTLGAHPGLSYSQVPLGIIRAGNVIVLKEGKGTKTLSSGDLIGLFETCDWLLTDRSRQIGEWTLVADTDTEIVFFDGEFLQEAGSAAEAFRSHLIELARADHVPQPISTLPLLDWVAAHTTRERLPECAIVVHTHLLPNSFPFFRHLSHLVGPGRIFVLEKPYSTIRSVFDALVYSGLDITPVPVGADTPYSFAVQKSAEVLWRKVVLARKKKGFTKLIVVDDGGDLWLSLPWDELAGVEIAGVEQTQRGITRIQEGGVRIPPIISVASCGTKKLVESEFIGLSVVKKLRELGALAEGVRIGILGAGSIGRAIERALEQYKYAIRCYDPIYHADSERPACAVSSMDALLNQSDLIIGSVGADALTGAALERVSGTKTFASASSADTEFESLLSITEPSAGPFDTKTLRVHDNLRIEILNGGYPINFDREKDSTPDEDIALTRCLLYIGAMQAARLLADGGALSGLYRIDPASERRLLEEWLDYKHALGQVPPFEAQEIPAILAYNPLPDALETPVVWQEN